MSESDNRYYLSVKDTPKFKAYKRRYQRQYREQHPGYDATWRLKLKIEVLSHYGPQGKLQCAWPDCSVTDVDMLSLDHIRNDGRQDRRGERRGSISDAYGYLSPRGGGDHFYQRVRKAGYPEGLQTLCHNHQWKKELMRLREKAANKEQDHESGK